MSLIPNTMEPAMSRTGSALLIAAMFAVACSDNENNADRGLNSTAPGVDEITVNTTRDVGDNLAIHFQRLAGKPPVGATLVRFDFSETSRELRDDQGVVTGDFIFSALEHLVHLAFQVGLLLRCRGISRMTDAQRPGPVSASQHGGRSHAAF